MKIEMCEETSAAITITTLGLGVLVLLCLSVTQCGMTERETNKAKMETIRAGADPLLVSCAIDATPMACTTLAAKR